MARPEFNAIEHSYAETKLDYSNSKGRVQILRENPREIVLEVNMETPGLVILADLWYSGWEAAVNGETVPIVRANHSLRGIEMPAGHSEVVMTYRPASLKWGLRLSCGGLIACVVWWTIVAWRTIKRTNTLLKKSLKRDISCQSDPALKRSAGFAED